MAWARVDDGFTEHPKLAHLEADPVLWAKTVALWMSGLLHATRNATDGVLARARIARLVPFRDALKIADQLVACGLWEDHGTYFLIHDFLDYNPSRGEREEATKRKTHRQRKWRDKARVDARVDAHVDASTAASVDGAPPRARIPAPPRPEIQEQKLPSPSAPAPFPEPTPTGPVTSAVPAPPGKAPGRKRPEKPPDPRHAPFVAHFVARWEAVVGSRFAFSPRDAAGAARVLALGDNAEIRRRLEIALADPFFRKRGRVEQLADGWNGYAVQSTGPPARAGPEPPRYVRMVRDPESGEMVPASEAT